MKQGLIIVGFVGLLGICFLSLEHLRRSGETGGRSLEVFCASGVERPVTEIAKLYQEEYGVVVQLQYGGTGALLSQLQIARRGDVFIAADGLAVETAREKRLVSETRLLARQFPVIAVAAGNPKGIRAIDDLLRDDVHVAIGNPGAASIGKATEKGMAGRWGALKEKAAVMKLSVTELAQDLQVGAVDAAVIWNSTVPMVDGLEVIRVTAFDAEIDMVSASVLTATGEKSEALRLVRYLSDPEKGGAVFRRMNFEAPN